MNVERLGQVFTPDEIVNTMIGLIKNINGEKLEPSCGDGSFLKKLTKCIGLEIDIKIAHKDSIISDFFDYSINNKFDTIIGNPPYVRHKDILEKTKSKLPMEFFDKRSNLYLFFIYKSILHLKDGGEIIFITPRDFLKSTSSINLNKFIYKNGTITNIIDLGDKSIFDGYMPNCIIFRFEKGNFNRRTKTGNFFKEINGQLMFLADNSRVKFSDIFYVKVGAVSGADNLFENAEGNKELVFSKTVKTGKTKRMFYNTKSEKLLKHKKKLLLRKIKKFNEDNWWKWGRGIYFADGARIYVNCKTRVKAPFFKHSCKNYDGSVLGVFIKKERNHSKVDEIIQLLNKVNWVELGFVCEGRFIFSQRSLENTLLPNEFRKYL